MLSLKILNSLCTIVVSYQCMQAPQRYQSSAFRSRWLMAPQYATPTAANAAACVQLARKHSEAICLNQGLVIDHDRSGFGLLQHFCGQSTASLKRLVVLTFVDPVRCTHHSCLVGGEHVDHVQNQLHQASSHGDSLAGVRCCGHEGKVPSPRYPSPLHPTPMIQAPIHVNLTYVHLTKLIYIIVIICGGGGGGGVVCVCVCVFSWTSESYLLGIVSNNTQWTFIPSALWGQNQPCGSILTLESTKGYPCNVAIAIVCVFVCVGLYIPAIVDRHRDFYMQTWTFVNRGRPRILEEVH